MLTRIMMLIFFGAQALFAQEGKLQFIVQNTPDQSITALNVSSNGRLMATGHSDGMVFVWDIATRKILTSYKAHSNNIYQIQFIGDTGGLFSRSSDSIHVMDIQSGQLMPKPVLKWDRSGSQPQFAFSKDGTLMFFADWSNPILVYDMTTGKQISIIPTNKKVTNMAASSDGTTLIIADYGGYDKEHMFHKIDVATKNIGPPIKVHKSIGNLRFSPDGNYIAFTSENIVRLWDVKTMKEKRKLEAHGTILGKLKNVRHIDFSKSGTELLSLGLDNVIITWDVVTGKIRQKISDRDMDQWSPSLGIVNEAIQPSYVSGDWLIVAGIGREVRVWTSSEGKPQTRFQGQTSLLQALAFNPDGSRIAMGFADATIKIFDLTKVKMDQVLRGHDKAVVGIAFSPDGKTMASMDNQTNVLLWDIAAGRVIKQTSITYLRNLVLSGKKCSVTGFEFNDTGTGLGGEFIIQSSSTEKIPFLWNLDQDQLTLDRVILPKSRVTLSNDQGAARAAILADTWKKNPGRASATSSKGMLAVVTLDNGVRFWDLAKQIPMASLYCRSLDYRSKAVDNRGPGMYVVTVKDYLDKYGFSEDYLVMNNEGYYLSTLGGLELVSFTSGLRTIRLDQFDYYFNRPDLVLKSLGTASPELIASYESAYKKRIEKLKFDKDVFARNFREGRVPDLQIKTGTSSAFSGAVSGSITYKLPLEVEDSFDGISRIHVYTNGVPLDGSGGREFLTEPGVRMTAEIPLTLSAGSNLVEVAAENKSGIRSVSQTLDVQVMNIKPVKPDLYIVAVGVSKFRQSEYNLTYAAKDARDMVQALLKKTDVYGKIVPIELTDESATREKILESKEALKKSKEGDVVVVFVASHGLLSDNMDYFIATHDVDFAAPAGRGLGYDDLEALLSDIPARNKVLMIDACHSGELDKEDAALVRSETGSSGTLAARGFKTTVASKSQAGAFDAYELMQKLFPDFRKGNGAIVISAAGGKEYALESKDWNNGVFTFAMLEGLTSGNADRDKDKKTTINELRTYIFKRVIELTGGKQNPRNRRDNWDNDFVIW